MFENSQSSAWMGLLLEPISTTIEHMSSTEQATAFIAELAALDTTGTHSEHIDEIAALEKLKSAITARQARITDAFAVSQRAKHEMPSVLRALERGETSEWRVTPGTEARRIY